MYAVAGVKSWIEEACQTQSCSYFAPWTEEDGVQPSIDVVMNIRLTDAVDQIAKIATHTKQWRGFWMEIADRKNHSWDAMLSRALKQRRLIKPMAFCADLVSYMILFCSKMRIVVAIHSSIVWYATGSLSTLWQHCSRTWNWIRDGRSATSRP